VSSIFAMAWPGYVVPFTALMLAAGGIGSLLLGEEWQYAHTLRGVCAETAVGVLVWCVLFALLSSLGAPLWMAVGALGIFVLLGVAMTLIQFVSRRAVDRRRLGVPAGLGACMLVAGIAPVNGGAADASNYAYIAETLFHWDWVPTNLAGFAAFTPLAGLMHEGMVARSPEVALLWPVAAAGWGLDGRSIASLCTWFLAVSAIALIDTLPGDLPVPARTILAVGAIGSFNAASALVGGQANQAFAVAVSVVAVWLYRWLDTAVARFAALVLAAAAIAAGYPEFLAALPLYYLCLLVVRPFTWREATFAGLSLAAGVALVASTSRLGNLSQLVNQTGTAPLWWPLERDPTNAADQWWAILVQRLPPRAALLAILPAVWFGWRAHPPHVSLSLPRTKWLTILVALAVLALGWSLLLSRAANVNYATFKIGGWLGPGLLLIGVAFLQFARPTLGRALLTLILALAVVRSLGFAAQVAAVAPDYLANRTSPPATAQSCPAVNLDADQYVLAAAIAGAAAPAQGCRVVSASGGAG
jgi:hypothetical protein